MNDDYVRFTLSFASQKLNGKMRKRQNIPYIVHPVRTSMLLVKFGINDQFSLATALLHDLLEETNATFSELQKLFGPRVAENVKILSDTKGDDKTQIIKEKISRIKNEMNPEQMAVLLADKLDNLSDSLFEAENVTTAKKKDQYDYYGRILFSAKNRIVSEGFSGLNGILNEYEQTLEKFRYVI